MKDIIIIVNYEKHAVIIITVKFVKHAVIITVNYVKHAVIINYSKLCQIKTCHNYNYSEESESLSNTPFPRLALFGAHASVTSVGIEPASLQWWH